MTIHKQNLLKSAFALITIGASLLVPQISNADESWMRGGNWADARDNYVDGTLVLSGLSSSSGTISHRNEADAIASYAQGIGMNMIRMPINPQIVANSTKWSRYKAAIDELVNEGMHVVLGCWEGTNKDGFVDDLADFETMWRTVDATYKNNWNVWYEPINEPHGYSSANLINLYRDVLGWLTKNDGRFILAGWGYSEDVNSIGASSYLSNCKLGQHIYAWYGHHTSESNWKAELRGRIGSYSNRTVVTEAGAGATGGKNYTGSANGDKEISFIKGITTVIRNDNLGFIYWPAFRDGDSYRLFNNTTSSTLTNTSLKNRIRYGWGI